MLPPATVTERKSDMDAGSIFCAFQRVFDWIASDLGSIKLVYKKRCCYGTCKSDIRYSEVRYVWFVSHKLS